MRSWLWFEWAISATRDGHWTTSPTEVLSTGKIVVFRFQKRAWHKMVSSSLQHLWVQAKGLCNSWVISFTLSLHFFLYHSSAFSLQLLSVSYLPCHYLFTCLLSSLPWHCIFMPSALSQTYSIQPLRDLSLPVSSQQSAHFLFSLSDAFLLHGHFLIYSALLHPDSPFRIQMHFLCSTLCFLGLFLGWL